MADHRKNKSVDVSRKEIWGRRLTPENAATKAWLEGLDWRKTSPPPAGYRGLYTLAEAVVRVPGAAEFTVYLMADGGFMLDERDFASMRLAMGRSDA